MKLIDLPLPRNSESYSIATQEVTTFLATEPHVQAVYQVGTVRHPGISDIDLLVVVADDAASERDPLAGLAPERRYLFTHSCFVVPTSLAHDLPTYVLLDGFRHLAGAELPLDAPTLDRRTLEIQTALEFLAKNLVDLYIQLTYRVLKVRVFLQHVKAMKVDIEFTGLENGRLSTLLDRATTVVDDWFGDPNEASRRIAGVATELLRPLEGRRDRSNETARALRPLRGSDRIRPERRPRGRDERPARASRRSDAAVSLARGSALVQRSPPPEPIRRPTADVRGGERLLSHRAIRLPRRSEGVRCEELPCLRCADPTTVLPCSLTHLSGIGGSESRSSPSSSRATRTTSQDPSPGTTSGQSDRIARSRCSFQEQGASRNRLGEWIPTASNTSRFSQRCEGEAPEESGLSASRRSTESAAPHRTAPMDLVHATAQSSVASRQSSLDASSACRSSSRSIRVPSRSFSAGRTAGS